MDPETDSDAPGRILLSTYSCSAEEEGWIRACPGLERAECQPIRLPVSGSDQWVDLLVTGASLENRLNLMATVSDWNHPPVTVCILPEKLPEADRRYLRTHPRIGRSVFFCEPSPESLGTAMAEALAWHRERGDRFLDDATACPYTGDQISPRWLFEAMMAHLDEYLYFKDEMSRFLAVSQYLVEKCRQSFPHEVLGADDFAFFDERHAREAYEDEMKIVRGEISELHKEEPIRRDGEERWVDSRKYPLRTRSGFLAGSFGISRDITEAKRLRMAMEQTNERMLNELDLARNLQRTLLQQSLPDFGGPDLGGKFAFASEYVPSFLLSGDFYSLSRTPDGKAGILIADVMGHGVRSAMVTAMIRIAVQQLQKKADDPAGFLDRLNRILHNAVSRSNQSLFATALYGTLDFESGDFSFVQAGARHGLMVRPGGGASPDPFSETEPSPALGLFADAAYPASTVRLEAGDSLFLFTDGATEAADADGTEYGEERLRRELVEQAGEPPAEQIAAILRSIMAHVGADDLEDDVCLVAVRRND